MKEKKQKKKKKSYIIILLPLNHIKAVAGFYRGHQEGKGNVFRQEARCKMHKVASFLIGENRENIEHVLIPQALLSRLYMEYSRLQNQPSPPVYSRLRRKG